MDQLPFDQPTKIAAYAHLIELLKRYRGANIKRDIHPIHKAVVALENMSVKGGVTTSGRVANHLHFPATGMWLAMLWASRDGMPKFDPDRCDPLCPTRGDRSKRVIGPANPKLAMRWSKLLRTELERQMDELASSM